MAEKSKVVITIDCRDIEEMSRAKKAVMYHLETLEPEFRVKGLRLVVSVVPIDPKLFEAHEACDIIRLTLEQSFTFTKDWKCTLHTIN